jgi:HEAT repeat protein
MPLVKRGTAPSPDPALAEDGTRAIEGLRSTDPDTRWNAARRLQSEPAGVNALAAALAVEPVPRVREAIMTALMRIGSATSVEVLLPYLRAQDAARRGAAIEALQSLPDAVAPFMSALLRDPDDDVRILAIELVRGMPPPRATALLCDLLAHENHPNVCASAVDALAELGTEEALPVLRSCAQRFADAPFLPFAISIAIARVSDTKG